MLSQYSQFSILACGSQQGTGSETKQTNKHDTYESPVADNSCGPCCSQSKHGCFKPRKKVLSLEVLIGIIVDIYKNALIEIKYPVFSFVKHAGC